MNDTAIQAGAVVDCCMLEKEIKMGANAHVGGGKDDTPNQIEPARSKQALQWMANKRAFVLEPGSGETAGSIPTHRKMITTSLRFRAAARPARGNRLAREKENKREFASFGG